MSKLNGFRKNLLVFGVVAMVLPMACRELVMVMIRPNGNSGFHDTLRRSGRQCFGKRLLSQLNCQSLQAGEITMKSKPCTGSTPGSPLPVSVAWITAQAAPAALGGGLVSTAPIPLRI